MRQLLKTFLKDSWCVLGPFPCLLCLLAVAWDTAIMATIVDHGGGDTRTVVEQRARRSLGP